MRAFELVAFERHSAAEAAEEVGRSVDEVYVAKSRMLQRLQSTFPGGVCDRSQAGVGQVGVTVDGSFGPSPVNRVDMTP